VNVHADNVSIVPTLATATTASGTVSPPTDLVGNTLYIYSSGKPATYTINYSAIATLAAGEAFGSVEFGLQGTSGLTLGAYNPTSTGWYSNNGVLVNGSFGPNPSTLSSIAASVGASATNVNFGITSPASLGSVAVSWNGVTAGQSVKITDGNTTGTPTVGQIQYSSESTSTGQLSAGAVTPDLLDVDFVPALPGDGNFDGQVNGLDLVIFAHNYPSTGVTTGAANGDFNGDGVVNGLDLVVFAHNYPSSWTTGLVSNAILGPSAAVATPEPASLGLLALGGFALLNRRRKA
jgi:hypothetical protein